MGVVVLAVLTVFAVLEGRRTLRDALNAPHRMYRWLNRVLVVAAPVFLAASWATLIVSGVGHGVLIGIAVAAAVPFGLAALGILLVFATAPSRRR